VKRTAHLLLPFLAGACAATPTPDREALSQALEGYSGMPVAPIALVHIGCQSIAGDPGVFACRWRQQEGRYWRGWQSRLAHMGKSWRIIGEPSRRP
jgi:hypothetical protein